MDEEQPSHSSDRFNHSYGEPNHGYSIDDGPSFNPPPSGNFITGREDGVLCHEGPGTRFKPTDQQPDELPPPYESAQPGTLRQYEPVPHEVMSQYPSGQYPQQYPPGQYPQQYPPGQYPQQYPPGQYPQQYPPPYSCQYPPKYPTSEMQEYPNMQPPCGQQQQSNLVMIGYQERAQATVSTDSTSFAGAISLACFVIWCCGWLCGVIAYSLAVSGQNASANGNERSARSYLRASIGFSIAGIFTGVIVIASIVAIRMYHL